MSDEALTAVLEALEIAAFDQRPDGEFASLGPVPAWFQAFGRSATFPFLGSFLEEARAFWSEPRTTRLEWGPCVETDGTGRQRQFLVTAISLATHRFLIFELDRNADDRQKMLQAARDQSLAYLARAKELRSAVAALSAVTAELQLASSDARRQELVGRLAEVSGTLRQHVDRLFEEDRSRAQPPSGPGDEAGRAP
jgi:hypothetical protein